MSIRDNLLLVKPDATKAELIDALKKANAWEFIQGLKDGWDTYVGTTGSQISGGQKQRIAIARSMLMNPKILLLDESTSALDRQNEREIQETLDKFSEGKTTIIIAHRLSTIKNADVIHVLKNGQVFESGSHDALMEIDDGYYRKLVEIQKEADEKLEIFEVESEYDISIEESIVLAQVDSRAGGFTMQTHKFIAEHGHDPVEPTPKISEGPTPKTHKGILNGSQRKINSRVNCEIPNFNLGRSEISLGKSWYSDLGPSILFGTSKIHPLGPGFSKSHTGLPSFDQTPQTSKPPYARVWAELNGKKSRVWLGS
jgi:ABC-type proline/glycine betaine transport system ATPase subunit